ncbi:hypothetical protein LZ31DRAFT_146588 [Colletotrichum somersetense]|nr:hypothetical protein LZ31DRAFT_146588 [Colletotrichum somersetense]
MQEELDRACRVVEVKRMITDSGAWAPPPFPVPVLLCLGEPRGAGPSLVVSGPDKRDRRELIHRTTPIFHTRDFGQSFGPLLSLGFSLLLIATVSTPNRLLPQGKGKAPPPLRSASPLGRSL